MSNGKHHRSGNGNGNGGASTATESAAPHDDIAAIMDESPLDAVEFRDGIYEVWLDPGASGCTFRSIEVPIFEAVDPKSHKPRRFNLTIPISDGACVMELSCPACRQTWRPEQPLRPGAMLKWPTENKWRLRFRRSFECPSCRSNGKYSVGMPKTTPDKGTMRHRVRTRVALSKDEFRRLVEYRNTSEYVPREENVKLADGTETTRIVGYKSRPLIGRWTYRDGDNEEPRQANLYEFIRWRYCSAYDDAEASPTDIDAKIRVQRAIEILDRKIHEVGSSLIDASANEAKTIQAELKRLLDRRRELMVQAESIVTY